MAAKKPNALTVIHGASNSGVPRSTSGGDSHSQEDATTEDSLAPICEKLKEESRVLQAKADSLRSGLSLIEENLDRVHAALAALSGSSPTTAVTGGSAEKKQRKAAAPAANKKQVLGFIRNALADSEPLQVDDVRARVEKQLADEGFSKLGFALRFKEALADESLVDSSGHISRN